MKKIALLGSTAAAVAMLAAPSAQAAGSPYFPNGEASVHHASGWSPLYFSDTVFFCENGHPEWATAVKLTGKAQSLYITESRSYFKTASWTTPVIGDNWVVLKGHPGERTRTPADGSTGWGGSARARLSPSADSWEADFVPVSTPRSCQGLPTALPALGQAPGTTVTPKPTPTKTTPAPKPSTTTSTKPAPKPSTTSTAPKPTKSSGTVKPSTGTTSTSKPSTGHGHSTTTAAPVPVTTSTGAPTAPATHHAGGTTAPKPSTTGNGPVVQTDGVGGENALGMELGLGAAAVAAAGGALVVARRRQG